MYYERLLRRLLLWFSLVLVLLLLPALALALSLVLALALVLVLALVLLVPNITTSLITRQENASCLSLEALVSDASLLLPDIPHPHPHLHSHSHPHNCCI